MAAAAASAAAHPLPMASEAEAKAFLEDNVEGGRTVELLVGKCVPHVEMCYVFFQYCTHIHTHTEALQEQPALLQEIVDELRLASSQASARSARSHHKSGRK